MRVKYYEEGRDGSTKLLLGKGVANSFAYLSQGFRNWGFVGFVQIQGVSRFGLEIEGLNICAVYASKEERECQSDETAKEQLLINQGKTAIVLFKGIDNVSVMRRMTLKEYEKQTLKEYSPQPNDLFYNS